MGLFESFVYNESRKVYPKTYGSGLNLSKAHKIELDAGTTLECYFNYGECSIFISGSDNSAPRSGDDYLNPYSAPITRFRVFKGQLEGFEIDNKADMRLIATDSNPIQVIENYETVVYRFDTKDYRVEITYNKVHVEVTSKVVHLRYIQEGLIQMDEISTSKQDNVSNTNDQPSNKTEESTVGETFEIDGNCNGLLEMFRFVEGNVSVSDFKISKDGYDVGLNLTLKDDKGNLFKFNLKE